MITGAPVIPATAVGFGLAIGCNVALYLRSFIPKVC